MDTKKHKEKKTKKTNQKKKNNKIKINFESELIMFKKQKQINKYHKDKYKIKPKNKKQ